MPVVGYLARVWAGLVLLAIRAGVIVVRVAVIVVRVVVVRVVGSSWVGVVWVMSVSRVVAVMLPRMLPVRVMVRACRVIRVLIWRVFQPVAFRVA